MTGLPTAAERAIAAHVMQLIHSNDRLFLPEDGIGVAVAESIATVNAEEPYDVAVLSASAVDLQGRCRLIDAGQPPEAKRIIVALPAQSEDASNIWAELPCAEASDLKADYVVTQFGIAKLRGSTCAARRAELIALAYPDFRDRLLHAGEDNAAAIHSLGTE